MGTHGSKIETTKRKRVKWLWHVGALIPQLAYNAASLLADPTSMLSQTILVSQDNNPFRSFASLTHAQTRAHIYIYIYMLSTSPKGQIIPITLRKLARELYLTLKICPIYMFYFAYCNISYS